MTGRNNIQAELNELNSSLPAGLQEPVFNLPQGYFENFAASVIARIKTVSAQDELSELSPLLAGIPKSTPFAVPENYFSTLEPIPAEDELPAVLKYIGKDMPYELPAGYFEGFAGQVKAALKPARVVRMHRSWSRMAVAAMTAGIITLGSFLYFGNKAGGPAVDSPAWVSAKLDKVSDKGLQDFINATDAADEPLVSNDGRSQDVKALLSDVTVNDMDAFLDELPYDEEELPVIN